MTTAGPAGPVPVVVWTLPIGAVSAYRPWLSDTEQTRANAFRRAADADRFTAGAVLVRAVGALAGGIAPAAVAVDRSCPWCPVPHGRPRIAGPWQVSVSHAGDWAVLAAVAGLPIGVDIEPPESSFDAATAEVALSARERSWAGSDAERLRVWVRKEAALKALGVGLMVEPRELEVSPAGRPAAVLCRPDAGSPGRIGLTDLALPELVSSLALVGADPTVRLADGTDLLRSAAAADLEHAARDLTRELGAGRTGE